MYLVIYLLSVEFISESQSFRLKQIQQLIS